MEFKPRNRVPGLLAVILIALGVIFALLGLIPIVGWIVDFCSWILFSFIFYIRGASFTRNKSALATPILSLLAGLIPEAGDFIGDIIGLAVAIYLVRKEDKLYNIEQLSKIQTKAQTASQNFQEKDDDDTSLPTGYKQAA